MARCSMHDKKYSLTCTNRYFGPRFAWDDGGERGSANFDAVYTAAFCQEPESTHDRETPVMHAQGSCLQALLTSDSDRAKT